MRVFVTGARGFIGTRIVPELVSHGHEVVGLATSEQDGRYLAAAGVAEHRGDLDDLESLTRGAANADAVIHCAFVNDFARLEEMSQKDDRAIRALASGLKGRPLIVSSFSGLGNTRPGELALETNDPDPADPNRRVLTELAVQAVLAEGANASIVRLPTVHDPHKQGVITAFVAHARQTGVSAYVGEGATRVPSAFVADVARLYRLAVERGARGARYHAVAEEGVPCRAIAEMIGRGADVPVRSIPADEAETHFGHLAGFAAKDLAASSERTKAELDWHPVGPSLLADMELLLF